jgi:hypothetical protein
MTDVYSSETSARDQSQDIRKMVNRAEDRRELAPNNLGRLLRQAQYQQFPNPAATFPEAPRAFRPHDSTPVRFVPRQAAQQILDVQPVALPAIMGPPALMALPAPRPRYLYIHCGSPDYINPQCPQPNDTLDTLSINALTWKGGGETDTVRA